MLTPGAETSGCALCGLFTRSLLSSTETELPAPAQTPLQLQIRLTPHQPRLYSFLQTIGRTPLSVRRNRSQSQLETEPFSSTAGRMHGRNMPRIHPRRTAQPRSLKGTGLQATADEPAAPPRLSLKDILPSEDPSHSRPTTVLAARSSSRGATPPSLG